MNAFFAKRESFAAERGGKDASGTSRKHRSLRSPLEAVLNRRIIAWSGKRTTDSPRARSERLHSLVLAAPAQRGPEVVPAKATCGWFWYFCHQKYRESRDDVAGVLYLFSAKSTDRSLRLVLFAAFWSTVNRGLRPRKVMYFLAAKSTKNSPADAYAYFVPANVRNGRLFAGAHAPRPRFLPLLAGPSFHGSGIGPESFAAKRGGEEAQQQDRKRSILPSPLKAVLNRRIIAWSGIRTTDSPRARSGRL